MQNSFRTDLAAEAFEHLSGGMAVLRGAAARQEELFGLPLFAVSITGEEAAEKTGKPVGQYYTLSLASALTRAAPDFGAAAVAVAALIRRCGVPTVTDASPGDSGPGGLFVTPRDIDSAVRACARIIAYGINLALHPSLTVGDIDALNG